ncbi:RNA polymerase sigma factor (plasmid) [Pseudoalteromonas sp. T1lg65]|uniref:RNA polymerase sigma factor n=1 Tax=Pseudoalteromonas sp. T1lg65 TaxID=2077101 RepID=UPI003F7A3746
MQEEKQLMLRVKEGELDCLAPLFERYKRRLFQFFMKTGHNKQVSEDLVQETFMRVLAYRTGYSGEGAFSTWLYSIGRNTAVDHYRRNKNSMNHDELDEEAVNSDQSLGENFEIQERQKLFDRALLSISAEHREILVLSRFQQMKYEEIAAIQGCNVNTLKSRMVKAVELLKAAYQSLCGEEKS